MTLTMEETANDRVQKSNDVNYNKPYNFSVVPIRVEQHLEFIDISEDGYLLLGSSSLVINYWNGSIWYFQDGVVEPDINYSLTGHGCEYSVGCGKFLENREKIIIGDDSGAITVFSVETFENDTTHIIPHMTSINHDSGIISLSVTPSKNHTVSAGNDLAINVWDNERLLSEHKYMPAHARYISCVACSHEELKFVSSSLDGSVLLWDPRLSKSASTIKQTKNCGLTALSWKDENELAIGSQSGTVAITDIRTNKDIFSESLMDCSIHNLNFNSDGLLGICGDSKAVKVWDYKSKNIIYTDERHTGLVRGLAWHPLTGKLYSCGFDKQIFSHVLSES